MKIINLTPHDVVINGEFGYNKTYPASGYVARIKSNFCIATYINGTPIERENKPYLDFGIDIIEEDCIYIVSYIFAMKLKQFGYKNINQFVYPNCLSAKRNKNNWNNVISVPTLITCGL